MIAKIAWRNIVHKPLNTILSLILLTSAVAIISLLMLLQEQFEKQFSSNIDDIDMVIGAKGSPLQLILSAVYQIDAPTGNISYDQAKTYINHPFAKSAVPLAFGDNYRGFKIVGTTPDYVTLYGNDLQSGKMFATNFEVVIGSEIAAKLGLKIGDKFHGSHGDAIEGEVHEEYDYVVTGIAAPSGKVIDNLILTKIESVWAMHSSHDHNPAHGEEDHVHSDDEQNVNPPHGEEGHVHSDHEDENHAEVGKSDTSGQQITAVLIQFRNKMAFVLWPRLIAQNTDMQAVSPIFEINRLFSLFGIGLNAMEYLAYGIMIISGISIFIALYSTLKERKYEFALMRISGASRLQLLLLVLAESILLCVVGFILGTIVGRMALYFISSATEQEFKLSFNPWSFAWDKEGILLLVTIFVGIIAALIPAVKAYTLNISKTLSNG